jgi:hypothetical protein
MNEQVSQAAQAVGIGQAAQVEQEGRSAQQAAPATRATARKRTVGAKRSNGQAATTTSPDPNIRVCSITLPKDVFERYEQAAAAAPFEPSVQRYLSWELRELDKKRQAAAQARVAATQPAVEVCDDDDDPSMLR